MIPSDAAARKAVEGSYMQNTGICNGELCGGQTFRCESNGIAFYPERSVYFRDLVVTGVFNCIDVLVPEKLRDKTVKILGSGTYNNLPGSNKDASAACKIATDLFPEFFTALTG